MQFILICAGLHIMQDVEHKCGVGWRFFNFERSCLESTRLAPVPSETPMRVPVNPEP